MVGLRRRTGILNTLRKWALALTLVVASGIVVEAQILKLFVNVPSPTITTANGTQNLLVSGTVELTPGSSTVSVNRKLTVLIKGYAGGGTGAQGNGAGTGGGGGGSGASDATGENVQLLPGINYAVVIGGLAANTSFRIPASTFYLELLAGGGGTIGVGGAGGGINTGAHGLVGAAGGDSGYPFASNGSDSGYNGGGGGGANGNYGGTGGTGGFGGHSGSGPTPPQGSPADGGGAGGDGGGVYGFGGGGGGSFNSLGQDVNANRVGGIGHMTIIYVSAP